MNWATVSSWSCFCWLYRASPSSTAKSIINLIFVLTIWLSMKRVFSCAVGRRCLLWPVHSLGKSLLAFVLLHFVLQGQICLFLQLSWLPIFAFQTPIMKGHLCWVLVLEGLVGLHRTVQLQLLLHYWLGYRLGLLWYRMVCLGNEQRSFCHSWDCTQVTVFWTLLLTMRTTLFF